MPDIAIMNFSQVAEEVTLEDFCAADAAGLWTARTRVGGIVVLEYPVRSVIMTADGACLAVRLRVSPAR